MARWLQGGHMFFMFNLKKIINKLFFTIAKLQESNKDLDTSQKNLE